MDKLQRAERAFLLRLIAEYGTVGAARILRSLADELEEPRRRAPSGGAKWRRSGDRCGRLKAGAAEVR